jgi:hypothetical protein
MHLNTKRYAASVFLSTLNFIHLSKRLKEALREIKRASRSELYKQSVLYNQQVRQIKARERPEPKEHSLWQ